jgi:glycosyltransferase involved in cell wall biosynthesis
MTGSAEAPVASSATAPGLEPCLRRERERLQEAALPRGQVVVSCAAPYGAGGLGHHLREIVEALDRRGQPRAYICESGGQATLTQERSSTAAGEQPTAWPVPARRAPRPTELLRPLARVSPAWRIWKARVEFDVDAARALPPAEHLIAFNRQALSQFHTARRARYTSVSLMSGSPHVRHVARQHARAHRDYPLERSFGTHVARRYLAEYDQADRIYVASRYTWESFVAEGVPEDALGVFPLIPDARYRPDDEPRPSVSGFDVVYAGSLTVAKGVPLLVDAVLRLALPDLRLILVGGWRSRGMRRFLQAARERDPRIVLAPGDPLPHLRGAGLCVHPTYEDGFAYAPAEALACGVPVLVSEDTGMKELVQPGRTGAILPTGDLDALSEAIEAAYRGELLGGGS